MDQRLAAVMPMEAGDVIRLGLVALATFVLGTFFSNTAIASMLMPVAAIAAASGVGTLNLTAYALTIALVASLSMALPVSTPPNAMAHTTGQVTRSDFVRTGGYLGLAGAALVVVMFAFLR